MYHDGSHYVGIQRTPRERRYRPREKEEVFFFDGEPTEEERERTETRLPETEPREEEKPQNLPVQRYITKSGEFNRLYDESRQMRRWERKQYILKNIRPLFKSDQEAASYVDKKLRDKKRALAERRLRFRRKAYMRFQLFRDCHIFLWTLMLGIYRRNRGVKGSSGQVCD